MCGKKKEMGSEGRLRESFLRFSLGLSLVFDSKVIYRVDNVDDMRVMQSSWILNCNVRPRPSDYWESRLDYSHQSCVTRSNLMANGLPFCRMVSQSSSSSSSYDPNALVSTCSENDGAVEQS